jgi:prepilin signal peptidase PulO-like enzyme (type II secretory pathway)
MVGTLAYAMLGCLAGSLVSLGADVLPGRPWRRAQRQDHCRERRPALRRLVGSARALVRRWLHQAVPHSLRTLATELSLAGLFGLGWHRFGPSPRLWLFSLYASLFVLVFIIDLEHRLVLNRVVLAGALLSLGGSLLWQRPPLAQALLGGVTGFALLLLIALAKPGAMGMGDVKLAGLIGLVLGYPMVFYALGAGIVLGGVGAAVLMLSRHAQRGSTMPYAPFLVTGALVGLIGPVQ